jgi:hypothetical protein
MAGATANVRVAAHESRVRDETASGTRHERRPQGAFSRRRRPRRIRLTQRDTAIARRVIQTLRNLLNALGCRIKNGGDRDLRCLRAIGGGNARVLNSGEFLLQPSYVFGTFGEFVSNRQRGHHGEPHVADLSELRPQFTNPQLEILSELHQVVLLAVLARHTVLATVYGDAHLSHTMGPVESKAAFRPKRILCPPVHTAFRAKMRLGTPDLRCIGEACREYTRMFFDHIRDSRKVKAGQAREHFWSAPVRVEQGPDGLDGRVKPLHHFSVGGFQSARTSGGGIEFARKA